MKVSELISLLQQQNPDADVQFDTITIDANSKDEAEALAGARESFCGADFLKGNKL